MNDSVIAFKDGADVLNDTLYLLTKSIYIGVITGTIIGLENDDKFHGDPGSGIFEGSGIGIIAAGIAGYFAGWRYVYEFNIPY